MKVLQNIKSDAHFPDGYKAEALRLLEPQVELLLFRHAWNSVMKGAQKEALAAAGLLERHFDSKKRAASIKALVTLDRIGLRPLLRFGFATTKLMRHEGLLFALMHKRKYQQIVNQVL
jgi:hypothetical protein